MKNIIYLDGSWDFRLDADKAGLNQGYFHSSFNDTINLPGTTSQSKRERQIKNGSRAFLQMNIGLRDMPGIEKASI